MRYLRIPAALLLLGGLLAPTPAPAGEGRPVTFWHIQNYKPTKPVVEAARERAVRRHPEFRYAPAEAIRNDTFKQKLNTAMAGGNPPDIFHTWGGGVLAEFVRAEKVLDLTERLDEGSLSRFRPEALEFCRVEERLRALPADMSLAVFWYNKDIFREHGVEPPETFAELLDACRKLRAAGVTPIALGNKPQWPGAFFFVYLATRIGPPGYFEKAVRGEEGCSLSGEPFVRAGKLLQELVKARAFSQGYQSDDYAMSRAEFFQGRAAMTLMGTWLLAHAKEEAKEMLEAGSLGVFPFPEVAGGEGDPTVVVGGINAAYAVSSSCPSPEAAVALLEELTSDETSAAWEETGRFSALLWTGNEEAARREERLAIAFPSRAEAARILRAAGSLQLYYDQALPPRLAELHKQTTQGLLMEHNPLSPEEAARQMEAAARGALRRPVSAWTVVVSVAAILVVLALLGIAKARRLRR